MWHLRSLAAVLIGLTAVATSAAVAGEASTPKTYALRADAFSLLGSVQLQESPGLFARSLIAIPPMATGIAGTGNVANAEGEQWLEVTYGGKTGWIRKSSLAPEIGLDQLLNPEPQVLPVIPPPPPGTERKAAVPDHIDMTVGTFAGRPAPNDPAAKSVAPGNIDMTVDTGLGSSGPGSSGSKPKNKRKR